MKLLSATTVNKKIRQLRAFIASEQSPRMTRVAYLMEGTLLWVLCHSAYSNPLRDLEEQRYLVEGGK